MKTTGHENPAQPRQHLGAYFDNNATTMVAPEVINKMVPLLADQYGNPSSVHRLGRQAAEQIAEAREKVAALVGASAPSEIVFTGSGTEADNLAITGILRLSTTRKHLITTAVEHPAVLTVCQHLADQGVCELTILPVDAVGQIDLRQLESALRPETVLVSIMLANNETGVVFDVLAAGEIVRRHGAIFHVDGVQAVGKLAVNLERLPVDLFSFSSHKLHGSKGVGALYVRKGTPLQGLILGGQQERGRRAGTENVAAIAGFGVACEMAQDFLTQGMVKVGALRDRLENSLLAAVPESVVNGEITSRVPTTSNMSFTGAEGEGILLMLDRHGVAVSSGAACSSGSSAPSQVLLSMGLSEDLARATVRFSLSRYSTEEEVDLILQVLPDIIKNMRRGRPS